MRPPRLHNPCRTASSSQNRRCSPCMCHLLQGCQLPNGQPLTFRLWEGEWMAEAVPAFLAGAGADTATADKVALRRRAGRGRCCDWQRTCPKLRPTTARSAQTRPTPSVAQRVPALEPARNPL